MTAKLKELLAKLGAEAAKDERDGKAIAALLDQIGAGFKTFEIELATKELGYKATDGFKAQMDQLRKDLDAEVGERRRIERMGLTVRGGGLQIPAGRGARLEMLADNRAFMDDEQAKRFGAYMVDCACRLWGRGDQCPKYIRDIADDVRKGMAEVLAKADLEPGTGAAGGYIIPDESRPELIRNVEATGTIFPRMRRLPLPGVGTISIPKRTAGLTAHWLAAGAQITRSVPTLDLVQLTPEKLAALVAVPNEFFRSGLLVDLGNWLGVDLVYAITDALEDAVVNGDGTAGYGGITGIMQSSNITAVTAADTHTTMATITGTDVSNVSAGVTVSYGLENPAWGMSLSVKGKLRALKDSNGNPLYQRGGNGEPNTIDDYPYVVSPKLIAAGSVANNTKYAFFGNLRLSHIVGMIRDIELARSDQAAFEVDMTLLRGIVHVDCQEADAAAVVTAKTAAA